MRHPMNFLDIDRIRAQTPGCRHVVHLNNAGAALSPLPVIEAIKNHIDLESVKGGYEAAQNALKQTEQFYDAAAQLIHCNRNEIAFIDNATRAWDMAFYSIPFKKGDKILTSVSEYASNYLALLHRAKQTGLIIDIVANDPTGQLDVADLKNKIDEHVKLIAITHVPSQSGLINPVEEVGKLAKKHSIPFLLDATQSIGQMPIDVLAIGCDFLCATGRKYLRGPRGTGFLYIRQEIIEQYEPPFVDVHAANWISDSEYRLRSDALRFETWEQNIAAKLGLKTAIEYALELGIPRIWERIQYLANLLRNQLADIPSIELQDLGINHCGIVTFSCEIKSALALKEYLTTKKINVSLSLEEYARLDLGKRKLPVLIRASVHYYNTENEISIFCNAVNTFMNTQGERLLCSNRI